MRLFLAIGVPPLQARALVRLKRDTPGWRWVAEENLHLTLAFFGDVGRSEAEELDAALSLMSFPLPEVTLTGIGHFGSNAPRAVWVGAEPRAPLADISERVTRAARRVGIAVARRRFIPHVTLARLGPAAAPEQVADFATRTGDLSLPPFVPRAVTLYQSHLRPEGPIYEPLADYPEGWP